MPISPIRPSTVVTAFLSFLLLGAGIAGLVLLEVRLKGTIFTNCPFCQSFVYSPAIAIMSVFLLAGLLGLTAAAMPQRGWLNAVAAVGVALCVLGVVYFHVATLLLALTSETPHGVLQSMYNDASVEAICRYNRETPCRGFTESCLANDITAQFNPNCPNCVGRGGSNESLPLALPRCGTVVVFVWQSRVIPVTALAVCVNVAWMLLAYIFALRAAYLRAASAPTAATEGPAKAPAKAPAGAPAPPPAAQGGRSEWTEPSGPVGDSDVDYSESDGQTSGSEGEVGESSDGRFDSEYSEESEV